MKKLFLIVTIALGAISTLNAQNKEGKSKGNAKGRGKDTEQQKNFNPEEKAKKLGEMWQKKLTLSDDEKAKFVAAKTTHLSKIQELRKSKPVNKDQARSIHAEFVTSVQAAFTPEHFETWKKIREEKKKEMKEKRDGKQKEKEKKDKVKKEEPKKVEGEKEEDLDETELDD